MPDKLHIATNNIDTSAKGCTRKIVIAIFFSFCFLPLGMSNKCIEGEQSCCTGMRTARSSTWT